jgi:hypothetical protein
MAVSSRHATWLVLRRPEDHTPEDQQNLDLVMQAHAQVKAACVLAQAFALMIRTRSAEALDPWRPRSEQQRGARTPQFCRRYPA